MRALAGPAMLLVVVGGFGLYRALSAPEGPPRDFLDRELAAPDNDDDHAGTCFSLSTVIIANTMLGSAQIGWTPEGDDTWTLSLEDVVRDSRGPVNVFQRFTFRQREDLIHLVAVEASRGQETDVTRTLDALLAEPNRRSTPVDRCLESGASGYRFRPRR
jgi:hypothetical protein